MLRTFINIKITQQPNSDIANRGGVIDMYVVHEYSIESTWEHLTDTATITFPKNIVVLDKTGKKIDLFGTSKSMGGGDMNVLFMRGDKITISGGYWYMDESKKQQKYVKELFSGFVSKVHSKIPLVIDCEDNMWLLKQTPAPDKFYDSKKYDMVAVVNELLKATNTLHKTNFTLKQVKESTTVGLNFSLGGFISKGKTVAQVLSILQKEYRLHSYFRGDELRFGYTIYNESEANNENFFIFQENIITDNLEYSRQDDVVLSMKATSRSKIATGKTTKDGKSKDKISIIEILITQDPINKKFTYQQKKAGDKLPEAEVGERRDFEAPSGITTAEKLFEVASEELKKYYYTGFKGDFTTFGMPYVKFGDNVNLIDKLYPDRNGRYKVKKVVYSGGVNGIRQEIYLDFKINTTSLTPTKNLYGI